IPPGKLMTIALACVAKTNGVTTAANVRAAIPVRAFKGMSAMIFLCPLSKILQLITSIRRPNLSCQQFFGQKTSSNSAAMIPRSASMECRSISATRSIAIADETPDSGGLLPPSPPAEQATACQDQAGQACTGYGPRHPDRFYVCRTLRWNKILAAIHRQVGEKIKEAHKLE